VFTCMFWKGARTRAGLNLYVSRAHTFVSRSRQIRTACPPTTHRQAARDLEEAKLNQREAGWMDE
jgi:hypothetical protein